ncbi:MAG: glycosyltransferase [Actinomycetes bacterium]
MTSPRIVMIVDNSITGDSRVQKSAREMAARGWDVTLIGNQNAAATRSQAPGFSDEYGEATVVWAALPRATAFTTGNRFTLRHPMAFRTTQDQGRSRRRLDWLTLELQQEFGSGASRPRRLLTQVQRKWVGLMYGLRSRATKARDKGRKARPPVRVHGSRQWRYDEPFLADLEIAYADTIDSARPDLIHAHDYRALPVAVRAADRLARKGKRPKVIYDAHEFLPGVVMLDITRHRGAVQAEAEYVPNVDAVITVSDQVADRLMQTHGITERPLLVYNTPMLDASNRLITRSLRTDAGIDAESPVLVYVGAASALRGLDTVIEALPQLPGVHFVTVSKESPYIASLRSKAATLGVKERFHRVDYVAADEVSAYVADATIGISPILHTENHNLGIPTKFFEYLHARIPIVTSDIEAAAQWVTENQLGLVYTAGDADGLGTVVRAMLTDIERFRAHYIDGSLLESWSWERQHGAVDALYRTLTGGEPDVRQASLERALSTLTGGEIPDVQDQRLGSELALESLALSMTGSDLRTQTDRLIRAQDLLFHRALHFDGTQSPLADDPMSYLAQWSTTPPMPGLQSTTRTHVVEATNVAGMRVTVLGYSNLAWAPPVVDAATTAGATVRVIDLADRAVHGPVSDRVLAQIALGKVPEALAEVMRTIHDESDVVWVEWAERAAVIATAVDPGTTRIIVRLHAYEAFKPALHYVQWGRVSDLVFVGPHFQDMVDAALETSPGYAQVRRHVIPLWFDLDRFDRPKNDDARFTLALLKWNNAAKDAPWAVDLLARVRATDPRYRLLLIGGDIPDNAPPGLAAYAQRTRETIERTASVDAVEFRPVTDDVPGTLTEVGVILSSSVRESFHAALVEGAASGAVPIVRDWPLMGRWDGPRRLFPSEWVVNDLDQGAERILASTTDADVWRAGGAAARLAVSERFGMQSGTDAIARLLQRDS